MEVRKNLAIFRNIALVVLTLLTLAETVPQEVELQVQDKTKPPGEPHSLDRSITTEFARLPLN